MSSALKILTGHSNIVNQNTVVRFFNAVDNINVFIDTYISAQVPCDAKFLTRANYRLCGAQWKRKMQAPCLKIIKNVTVVTAEP